MEGFISASTEKGVSVLLEDIPFKVVQTAYINSDHNEETINILGETYYSTDNRPLTLGRHVVKRYRNIPNEFFERFQLTALKTYQFFRKVWIYSPNTRKSEIALELSNSPWISSNIILSLKDEENFIVYHNSMLTRKLGKATKISNNLYSLTDDVEIWISPESSTIYPEEL